MSGVLICAPRLGRASVSARWPRSPFGTTTIWVGTLASSLKDFVSVELTKAPQRKEPGTTSLHISDCEDAVLALMSRPEAKMRVLLISGGTETY
jgi:hypothetical protein